ncbi:hypothetical protein QTP88_017386 [Uroleucon formosanum]
MFEKCSPKRFAFSLSEIAVDPLGPVIGENCCLILSKFFVVFEKVVRSWAAFSTSVFDDLREIFKLGLFCMILANSFHFIGPCDKEGCIGFSSGAKLSWSRTGV